MAANAVPHGRAVENARPRMESRVYIDTHLRKFSVGRPIMQTCFREAPDGNPKSEVCTRYMQNGRLMKIIRLWSRYVIR